MSPAPQLAEPGSSSYTSGIYHVGDGTWDSSRDTFLLPNLQTLPLEVTQYNGMGNRFRALAQYHVLIRGHGILAAITFLGVVPAAVMIARFHRTRNPRLALRMHIWLQILTLFLTTIIFILGWFAVGPERSLTNPHHHVGLTIYVLVWVQVLWGWLCHRREKKKPMFKVSIKTMLHQWLGRAAALLALAQIGTGITLYGSPRALFILYALALALLIIIYFALSHHYQSAVGVTPDGSAYSRSVVERGSRSRSRQPRSRSRHRGRKALLGLGALGLGAAAARRHRSRSRGEERSRSRHSSRHRSRRESDSFVEEKYSDPGERHTWRNRLLGAAAAGGVLAGIRRLMNRRDRDDRSISVDSYGRAPGGATTITQDDVSRAEAGQAPASPSTPRISRPGPAVAATPGTSPLRRPRPGISGGSISSSTGFTDDNGGASDGGGHGGHAVRNTIATLGVGGFLRHMWNRRGQRREDQRVEEIRRQDQIDEEIARRNSRRRRFTGDGSPALRRHRLPAAGGSIVTLSDSAVTGSTPGISRHNFPRPGVTPGPSGPSTAGLDNSQVTSLPPSNIPMPPPPASSVNLDIPPPPRPVTPVVEESGSEAYMSPGGGRHRRHRLRDEAALAGASAATAQRRAQSRESGVASPPVSVKVRMHNDGRHVTLRRLNEQEAAAEREARRRERRQRNGSLTSADGHTYDDDRWRRVEDMEAAQAAQLHNVPSYGAPVPMPMPPNAPGPPPFAPTTPAQQAEAMNLPPPPPIPGSTYGGSGMSPPDTGPYVTETDLSNYESNRRRRRAERTRTRAAQQVREGRVEFQ